MTACSTCGRDCETIVYCTDCRRELLCGSVAEPCTVDGCAERRIQEQYNDAGYCDFLAEVNPERLVEPRHAVA